jgi:ribosomal protein S18 acetylase RimI-like enzyme
MKLLSLALGDYGIYQVFIDGAATPVRSDISVAPIEGPDALAGAADPEIAGLATYARDGTYGFGAWLAGELAAGCWYADAGADSQRSTWPIAAGEAKLLQITTAARFRGKGLARALIAQSAAAMRQRGFGPLYARVWHSNAASQAAFRAAGWEWRALVLEFTPFGIGRPRRLAFRVRHRAAPGAQRTENTASIP